MSTLDHRLARVRSGERPDWAARDDIWFAWRPVRLGALGTGRWAWLRRVWRDRCCGSTIYQELQSATLETAVDRDKRVLGIQTENVFPPIPPRECDWLAFYTADDEESGRYGYGMTERAAIDDLLDSWPRPS